MTRRVDLRIRLLDGDPHPLDAEIARTVRALKALLYRRNCDRKRVARMGRPVSAKTRAKLRKAMMGRQMTALARARMSVAQHARRERERLTESIRGTA